MENKGENMENKGENMELIKEKIMYYLIISDSFNPDNGPVSLESSVTVGISDKPDSDFFDNDQGYMWGVDSYESPEEALSAALMHKHNTMKFTLNFYDNVPADIRQKFKEKFEMSTC